MKYLKIFLSLFTAIAVLYSCGTTAILSTPIENIDTIPSKNEELTDNELKKWNLLDLIKDTIPGMSVERAYNEIIKNKKGKNVIVGVIDSGVDIEHEDLAGVIWRNTKEKPNNGKDDDKNGYIDDIHGWNFLGDAVHDNYEYVRIVKNGDPKSAIYKKAKAEHQKEYQNTLQEKQQVDILLQQIPVAEKTIKEHLGKDTFTIEDVKSISSSDRQINQAKGLLLFLDRNDLDYEKIKDYADNSVYSRVNYKLNPEYDGRSIVGDNPDDLNDTDYGNNNVMGPDRESISHGTHVAGTIAAVRNNGKGLNGVAQNVKIMVLRAVPDGDEYDKDIALAIRYAVDNGAKIINTSFGKMYSTHPEWVKDAIKYAASKDVLIVNAAGNDSKDIDKSNVYPNDTYDGSAEYADNMIVIGAISYNYNGNLIAGFSNYGKNTVDLFAPGVKIWSAYPENDYEYADGTSMATPGVSGIAALIRSYYPKLSANQVKKILMNSGLPVKFSVAVGENGTSKTLDDISVSGKIANAYNALILADKVSRGSVNL
jgi:cell wall-associated protease